MLSIYVLDASAESRGKLGSWISDLIKEISLQHIVLPLINVKQVAIQELKFFAAPDICIVGSEILNAQIEVLSSIREIIPSSTIAVQTDCNLNSIEHFENFARIGISEALPQDITPDEFIRRLLLLCGKKTQTKRGKLILVESCKGGLGATTVTAGIGQVMALASLKTLLIDGDFETQDLSRFLQVRPFVNENLQTLLSMQRPLNEEAVLHCTRQVWDDLKSLSCMTPPYEGDDLYESQSQIPRIFLSMLEILDHLFDYVIIDIGSIRSSLKRALYRTADLAICIVGNDPAALFAATDKIAKVKTQLAPSSRMRILEVATTKSGLPSSIIREEISRIAKVDLNDWLPDAVPYCTAAACWPGSANTAFGLGSRTLRRAYEKNLQALGIITATEANLEFSWRTALSSILKHKLSDKLAAERSLAGTGTPELTSMEASKKIGVADSIPLSLPMSNHENANDRYLKDIGELVSEARIA